MDWLDRLSDEFPADLALVIGLFAGFVLGLIVATKLIT
jgi:hypothetical protein